MEMNGVRGGRIYGVVAAGSCFHKRFESGEGFVPLAGDFGEGVLGVGEAAGVEVVEGFAAIAGAVDEAGGLEDVEVFGDGLAGEGGAAGEAGDGGGGAGREAGEELEAGGVAEGGEEGGELAGGKRARDGRDDRAEAGRGVLEAVRGRR